VRSRDRGAWVDLAAGLRCPSDHADRPDPVRGSRRRLARQTSLIAAGTTLIAAGWDGLARLDPRTYAFTPLGGHDPGWLMAFDGRTIWASNEREVLRIRPADGSVAAKLSIPEAGGVAFRDGAAWVTSSGGVVEVDPATNVIVRTLPIGPSVAVVSDGPSLWVTSYGGNSVTEIRP
jgi:DNA-binding beta-propeller fold protein YncE